MKIFKNKIFVALVSVAIVLCILPTVLYLTGGRDLLREGLSLAAKPFRIAFSWAADGIEGFSKYFTSVDALIKENEALREELEQYKNGAHAGEIAEGENAWLRDQLGFVDTHDELTLQDASVIGYDANSYSSVYVINRGSECGIEKNMAVVSAGGVVGYVKEVGYGVSKVATLTDTSSAVGVYCTRSGIYGLAEGSAAYISGGRFVIEGLPDSADVQLGDIFCTSGYGGIFPKDLPVGRVVSVERDEFLKSVTVVLEPSVSLDSAKRVYVVKKVETAVG
jgi:rod shape-determining protein MreC